MIYAFVKNEPKYVGRTKNGISQSLSQYKYNVRNDQINTTAGKWMASLEDMEEIEAVLLEENPSNEQKAKLWWINYLEYLGANLVNEYRHAFGNTVEKSNGWDVPKKAKEMMGEVPDYKIGEKFGRSPGTIRIYRKRFGIDPAPKRIQLPDECIEQLGEKSDRKLADEYGVKTGVIKKRRTEREIEAKNSNLTKKEAGEVKWLYDNTEMSQKEIGKKYGKTGGCVRNIVHGRSHSDVDSRKPS